MKSRVFTIIGLLALMAAMCTASVASAQELTPGGDVYVKDFVQGDGNTDVDEPAPTPEPTPENDVAGECEEGSADDQSGSSSDGTCEPAAAVANTCANGADTDPVTGEPCNAVQTVSSGDLPFTGFEAGLVALLGAGLLGAGFAMRRFTRHGDAAA